MDASKDSVDIGILVTDVNASLHFYRNILGLKFIEKLSTPNGFMYRLRFGNSDVKLIDSQPPPARGPVGIYEQAGFRYLTFPVKNLSTLCQGLRSEGIEFDVDETEVRPGVRIAMVKDPEGNIVEFVQKS